MIIISYSLVTQPMMQRRLNPTKLRPMDSYIQILCIFQKSKQKVPPPSFIYLFKNNFHLHTHLFDYSVLSIIRTVHLIK